MKEMIWPILREILFQIFLFVAIFAESFPFLGALVPGGAILLFFAGVFAKVGTINIWATLIVCYAASVSIDFYGYKLGKEQGETMMNKFLKYVRIKEGFVHKLAEIIVVHPCKTLILGKFNPVTRSISPFMAGMKGLDKKRFSILNYINSAIWVLFFVGIGYVFGHGLKMIKFLQNWVIFVTIALFIILYLVYLAYDSLKKFKKNGRKKKK